MASLQRLGGRSLSPFAIKSDVGVEYNILNISPKRLKRRLHEGVDRWGWRHVLEKVGGGEEKVVALAPRVRSEWARGILHKKGSLTAQERGALRTVMDGSVWTEEKCWEEGYMTFPLCKGCLAGVGNTKHRAFECGKLLSCEGKELKEAWREEGRRAGKNDPFWTRLIPLGPERVPWPNKDEVRINWIGEEGVVSGEVFGDGSVKGRAGLKRGGSAFGVLRSAVEEEIWDLGDEGWGGLG